MPKSTNLIVRLEPALKRRLENASKERGVPMTTIVETALTRELDRMASRPPSTDRVFQGVPAFFRANCLQVHRGGAAGYDTAGWHLALNVSSLIEHEGDDAVAKLKELEDLVRAGGVQEGMRRAEVEEITSSRWFPDEAAGQVLAWFEREFPRCIALVPARRRAQFVKGVYQLIADRGIWR